MDNRFIAATLFLLIFLFEPATGVTVASNYSNEARKTLRATRVSVPPVIDGRLEDPAWLKAEPAAGFVMYEPHNDRPASFGTYVRVVYDDRAIYVGAMMKDPDPAAILTELGLRNTGNSLNADRFWININPFDDGINGFTFEVSASGVQTDINLSGSGGSTSGSRRGDSSWDAVWKSEVRITDDGWIAEIEIPWSALRFPKTEVAEWGINFWREVRRTRETSSWNFVNRRVGDPLRFMGGLGGIEGITPPVRLGFFPYMTGYVEHNSLHQGWGNASSLGMDVKLGLSQNFTLDMALIPDFTQVQSDAKVLNLTPHEVRYDEQRQFFTEGVELFGKADLFYSRRIGSRPGGYREAYGVAGEDEVVLENPMETMLINASKVSGRTGRGLGIGVFNAMTAPGRAVIQDVITGDTRYHTTQPFTNYNLVVADQTLPNNSFVSLVNTNVAGSAEGYTANVTGTEFRFFDNSNLYSIRGAGALSQQYYSADDNNFGYKYNIGAGKYAGTWQYNYSRRVITDTYDQNDMGFLRRNNLADNEISLSHNIFEPFWRLFTLTNSFTATYSTLYRPGDFTRLDLAYNIRALFDTRFFALIRAGYQPAGERDYFEPRVPGRFYETGQAYSIYFMYSTDYRKRLYFDGNMSYNRTFTLHRQEGYSAEIRPTFRVNDRIRLSYGINYNEKRNDAGYVMHTAPDSVYFGLRPSKTLTNTLRSSTVFTNDLSLSFDLRHYWSRVNYTGDYFLLSDQGRLAPLTRDLQAPDINYNAFTIDMMLTWHFAPGSQLTVLWKNVIDNRGSNMMNNYFDNLRYIAGQPQINSFSLRILYYLDYHTLQPLITGRPA
ncbi:MAG: hypothetical protein EA408_03060 [Marinilabiliales bacterium]|nr:MAG: hypothetical protein EA408_03060 [Marinilabiliales bacterium]